MNTPASRLDDRINDLIARRDALNDELLAEFEGLVAQIRLIVTTHDIQPHQIYDNLPAPAESPAPRKSKGSIVPPKYQSADGTQTWKGRGFKPVWLVEAMAAGATLDSLKIPTTLTPT